MIPISSLRMANSGVSKLTSAKNASVVLLPMLNIMPTRRNNQMLRFLIFAFIFSLSTFAGDLYYLWQSRGNKYYLVLFLDNKVCFSLKENDIFLYISPEGRVFRKTVKRVPENCQIYKRFSAKFDILKIILIKISSLEIKDLGIIQSY